MNLVLYHYQNSVCSQKVRLVLAEKNLPYESRHIDLMQFENLSDDYLTINPAGVVPTLVDSGQIICESTIIIEYLDDAYPDTALKPADALGRAAMRALIRLEDDTALDAVGVHTMNLFIGPMMSSLSADQLALMKEKHPDQSRAAAHDLVASGGKIPDDILTKADQDLTGAFDELEIRLGSHTWLAGNSFSLADATWVPFMRRVELLGKMDMIAPDVRPHIASWYEAACARPSFHEAIIQWEQSDAA